MKKGKGRGVARESDLGMYSPGNNDDPRRGVFGQKRVARNSPQTTVLSVGLDNIAGILGAGSLRFAANIKPQNSP